MNYCIFDPTGNITAIVETECEPSLQPAAAAEIMRRHPTVEQVGFLTLLSSPGTVPERQERPPAELSSDRPDASLRMAGGEFCGNASICAAALTVLRRGRDECGRDTETSILLRVSGVRRPVEVRLRKEGSACWSASVRMPPAEDIEEIILGFGAERAKLTLVRLEGIAHLIVEPNSPFFALLADRPSAEQAVRLWSQTLAAPGLGLMFLDRSPQNAEATRPASLTPLVYIPASDTLFWENSCASGSSAVGMALAARAGAPLSLPLVQPGGTLTVESDPTGGKTVLNGQTKLIGDYETGKAP